MLMVGFLLPKKGKIMINWKKLAKRLKRENTDLKVANRTINEASKHACSVCLKEFKKLQDTLMQDNGHQISRYETLVLLHKKLEELKTEYNKLWISNHRNIEIIELLKTKHPEILEELESIDTFFKSIEAGSEETKKDIGDIEEQEKINLAVKYYETGVHLSNLFKGMCDGDIY